MSKPAFNSRHFFSILAVGLICVSAGLILGNLVSPNSCRSVATGNIIFGTGIAGIYGLLVAAAWRRAVALGCKRALAVRVAGLMAAIFAAAVLQPTVACNVEPDYGPIVAAIFLFVLWFAVLLFAHLYVGRYAEALRRRYDSRSEEAEA